jgi:biotin/methionine sulfoxide reductase
MPLTATHWGVYRPVVENGRLVQLAPAPWDADPSPIGASVPAAVAGPSRVANPAVRAGFLDPRTRASSRDGRGREPYVQVGWEQALDLVAAELERVKGAHGNGAIFGGSYGWASAGRFHHAQSQLHRFLNGYGGYVGSTDSYSLGAGRVLMPHIVDHTEALLQTHTSWDNLAEHCELFVSFGGLPDKNAQVSPGGASDHILRQAVGRMNRGGVEFVNISPNREDLTLAPAAEWMAVKPGADTALMLGLAHVLIRYGLHDQAFLARYTTGFERVRAYILGEADGTPKSPEWASARTGIAASAIVNLAVRMASRRTMINCAYALQRAVHGEQPFWMMVTLAALLGQIGLPGGGFGLGYGSMNNTGSGRTPFTGPRLPQGRNAVTQSIPVARLVDMLEQPGGAYTYDGATRNYPDIRLIYWAGGNVFHHHQDLNRLIQAWRRPETIIVHEPYWTAQARHADIVLPATTALERDDIGSASVDRYLIAMKAAIAPVGEALDDHAILARLARRLGFEDTFTEGRDTLQWLRHLYEGTRERAAHRKIALPDFDTFWAQDTVELPMTPEPTIMLSQFRADPVRHRLPTPSGLIELYSATIAGFGHADCPGHAYWFEPAPSTFPLHLLSNQPRTRLHSQYDQGAASLATKIRGREPLTLHPGDAAARGIAEGDIVEVFNDRGAFLAGARLSADILPGVVQIATGAWYDPLNAQEARSLDKHGNPNMVTADLPASSLSQGCAAQTARVEIRRYDAELPPITAFSPPAMVAPRDDGDGA